VAVFYFGFDVFLLVGKFAYNSLGINHERREQLLIFCRCLNCLTDELVNAVFVVVILLVVCSFHESCMSVETLRQEPLDVSVKNLKN